MFVKKKVIFIQTQLTLSQDAEYDKYKGITSSENTTFGFISQMTKGKSNLYPLRNDINYQISHRRLCFTVN